MRRPSAGGRAASAEARVRVAGGGRQAASRGHGRAHRGSRRRGMGSYGWRRRAASVALAALTVCGLAGCGSGESGPPTLNWYINPDSGGQAEIANRCTQAAGGRYRIAVSVLPRESSEQREQLIRRLAAEDTLDRPHEPGPALYPRARRARVPRPGAGRAWQRGCPKACCPARWPAPPGRASSSPCRSGRTPSCSGTRSRSPRPRGWTCRSRSPGTSSSRPRRARTRSWRCRAGARSP